MKSSSIDETFYESIYTSAEGMILEANNGILTTEEVRSILGKRTPRGGISPAHVARLLRCLTQPDSASQIGQIIQAATALRNRLFLNQVSTMAPLEVSSFCMSNCKFCGWRSNNKGMVRLAINDKAIVEQTAFLAELGHSHIEVVAGDDLLFIKERLAKTIRLVKSTAQAINNNSRISICLTPLTQTHYQSLKLAGLDTVLTWQETYNRDKYQNLIDKGPKANGISDDYRIKKGGDGYLARITSIELAIKARLQVGMGVMLGLDDNAGTDILATVLHAQKLVDSYRGSMHPIIFGMPTWNPITTPETDNRSKSGIFSAEKSFELIGAIYLLAMADHYCWVFPNCRVSMATQIRTLLSSGCFTSTMVRVGPGAYLLEKNESDYSEYFSSSFPPNIPLSGNTLLKGEQFVHHFDSHANYVAEFKRNGLVIVSDQSLLTLTPEDRT